MPLSEDRSDEHERRSINIVEDAGIEVSSVRESEQTHANALNPNASTDKVPLISRNNISQS